MSDTHTSSSSSSLLSLILSHSCDHLVGRHLVFLICWNVRPTIVDQHPTIPALLARPSLLLLSSCCRMWICASASSITIYATSTLNYIRPSSSSNAAAGQRRGASHTRSRGARGGASGAAEAAAQQRWRWSWLAVGASAEGESAREGSLPPSPPSLTAAAAPGLCSLTGILPRSPLPPCCPSRGALGGRRCAWGARERRAEREREDMR